jgi:WD40 repeat protein
LALFDQANRFLDGGNLAFSDGSRLQVPNLLMLSWQRKPTCAGLRPGGATLGPTDDRQFLRFWRMADGQPVLTLEEEQFAFSPDGSLLAAWYYDDPALRAGRTTDGSLAYTLAGLESGVSQAKFSPQGNPLATVSGSGIIQFLGCAHGH